MNKFNALAAGLALSIASASCSAETTPQNTADTVAPSTWTVDAPEVSVEPLPSEQTDDPLNMVDGHWVEEGDRVRRLIQSGAPVNILLLQSEGPVIQPTEWSDEALASIASNDQTFLSGIKDAFTYATGGRYSPEVSVTTVPSLGSIACLRNSDREQSDQLKAHIQEYIDSSKLNLMYVAQSSCPDSPSGGYAGTGSIPIVTYGGFTSPDAAVHETGHAAGLGHAARADCAEFLIIQGCTEDPTGDPLSTMGYSSGKMFSTSELHALGLLEEAEVQHNPGNGEYTIGAAADKTLPLALTFESDEGLVYISWEQDPQAPFDTLYTEDPGHDNYDNPNLIGVGSGVDKNGERREFAEYRVNERSLTSSLQVREVRPDESWMVASHLITRPDRAPDFMYDTPSNGEVIPGTVVYRQGELTVIFTGVDSSGNATVRVEGSAE